jgi:hypothetical protein
MLHFIGAQLGITGEALLTYAARRQTRQQHLEALRRIYGYKMFCGRGARDLKAWLVSEAEVARSNEDLAQRFIKRCQNAQAILPGISVIERLCADALVAAERQIETRIFDRLSDVMKTQLDTFLTENVGGHVSRFIWLRQFEVGKNSADINRLLDRLEFLQSIELPSGMFDSIPPHQITRLRRQGERYLQTACGISPATGGWLFWLYVPWNGALPLLMPLWKTMIALSAKSGGMLRGRVIHRSPARRCLCRKLCALLSVWVRLCSKRKGMMRLLIRQ